LVATKAISLIEEPPSQRGRIESPAVRPAAMSASACSVSSYALRASVQGAECVDGHDLSVELLPMRVEEARADFRFVGVEARLQ
jgi:hypothetical protein